MNSKQKLLEFFQLEEDQIEFQNAITPKSCGGSDEFKMRALLGDRVLNLELYDLLTKEGITNSGEMTRRIQNYMHNKDILYRIGKKLKINEIMTPTDINHNITKGELKEAVEALIGANFKVHGFGSHKKVISGIYAMMRKIEEQIREERFTQILCENPIGKLQELYDKLHIPQPTYTVKSMGPIEEHPPFKCILSANFNGEDYEIESELFPTTKQDAKEDAAAKLLLILEGKSDVETILNPPEKTFSTEEETSKDSLAENLTFQKLSGQGQPNEIRLSSETGESTYEWAMRKAQKDPFRMLILLSYRIDDFKGATWHVSLPDGELMLSKNTFGGIDYYNVGFGPSKTQAKKNVGWKFIQNSNFVEWLKEHYGNVPT